MDFFHPNIGTKFWLEIVDMISENYVTNENHDSMVIINSSRNNNINDLKEDPWVKSKNYNKLIAYQLEPLIEPHYWSVNQMIENIRGADEIWDYDLHNIEVLQKYGIDAKFRPMKYTRSLKTINSDVEKDIDVLFFGSATEHRISMMNKFIWANHPGHKPNFVFLNDIYGSQLDNFIARSKIILNFNTWDNPNSRQQQTRIFKLLINEKCVVSEKSLYNYFGNSIYEFNRCDAQDLANKVGHILINELWKDPSNITFGKI